MVKKTGVQAMAYPDFFSQGEAVSEEEKKAQEQKDKRLKSLALDGMKLERIPLEERDKEICTQALRQNGYALQFIPEKDRDMYYCQRALRTEGLALQYVPVELRSGSVCRLACRNNGLALQFAPDVERTIELCTIALQQSSSALQYVPDALLDEAVCRLAMRVNGIALEYVPDALKTPSICYEAVRTSGPALKFVPEALMTPLLKVRAMFSAVTENHRQTTIVCQAPPDWEEIKKSKPRSEWGRFENWQVTAPESLDFPEELALPKEEAQALLSSLVRDYLKAAGREDCLDDPQKLRAGASFWVEVPAPAAPDTPEGEERKYAIQAQGLSLLLKEETDEHGVPVRSGAFIAAARLMDWQQGWLDENKRK